MAQLQPTTILMAVTLCLLSKQTLGVKLATTYVPYTAAAGQSWQMREFQELQQRSLPPLVSHTMQPTHAPYTAAAGHEAF